MHVPDPLHLKQVAPAEVEFIHLEESMLYYNCGTVMTNATSVPITRNSTTRSVEIPAVT